MFVCMYVCKASVHVGSLQLLMAWRLFLMRDKSSTRCSQRRLAEPGSAFRVW